MDRHRRRLRRHRPRQQHDHRRGHRPHRNRHRHRRRGQRHHQGEPRREHRRTAPSTDATAPTGWSNTAQTITLAPKDALSGVKATHYTLDGLAGTGTSVAVSGDGVHTLTYSSEDVAGNKEAAKTVEVKVDGTTPTIKGGQTPAGNGNGWNNGDVTVSFTCADSGSGIASCTPAQVIATEGKDQMVKGTATDNAGNSVSGSHSVSIDKGAPTIKASADRALNGNGWYDADVTVGFETGDALSGVDTAPAAKKLVEGANQSASGTVVDAAGNEASDGVTGINVDKTAPTLSGKATTAPNAAGWFNGDVTLPGPRAMHSPASTGLPRPTRQSPARVRASCSAPPSRTRPATSRAR